MCSVFPRRHLELQVNDGVNGALRALIALYKLHPTVTAHGRLMDPEGSFAGQVACEQKGVPLINQLGLDPATMPHAGTTRPTEGMCQPVGGIGRSIGHGLLLGADTSVTQMAAG